MIDFAPRYASALESQGVGFLPPAGTGDPDVVGRLEGIATSDFGVPGLMLPGDELPIDSIDLAGSEAIMAACWWAFDRVVEAADGKTLRVGPRGGGRSLEAVREVETAYAGAMGVKLTCSRRRGDCT